jgi:hypothetical protein
MNSLSELRDLCIREQLPIKEFGGWYLKIDKDIWTMLDGDLFKNGEKQSLKQKNLFDKYKRVKYERSESSQTRKWRGISSRNYRRN